MSAPAVVALVAALMAALSSTAALLLLLASRPQQCAESPAPGCGCVVVDRYGDETVEVDPTRCPIVAHHTGGGLGPRR